MASHVPELSAVQAQLLMSQLLDGELSPADAAKLEAHLARHPEAIDWMESLDQVRASIEDGPAPENANAAIAAISAQISQSAPDAGSPDAAKRHPRRRGFAEILAFPAAFRALAAAAAVTLVFGGAWLAFNRNQDPIAPLQPGTVEFVSTEIPDASTFVLSDDESGWTVVWVETFEPLPAKHG